MVVYDRTSDGRNLGALAWGGLRPGGPGRGRALVRPFAVGLGRGKGGAAGGVGARPWVTGSTWAGAALAVVGHSCDRSPGGSAVGRRGRGRWRGRSAVGDGFDLGRGGPGRGGARATSR